MQLATLDAVENFPAGQAVHVTAPVAVPVFVMDPALQSVHDATLDAVEYFPAMQAVHAVAPVPMPLFVMDPAPHVWQSLSCVCSV